MAKKNMLSYIYKPMILFVISMTITAIIKMIKLDNIVFIGVLGVLVSLIWLAFCMKNALQIVNEYKEDMLNSTILYFQRLEQEGKGTFICRKSEMTIDTDKYKCKLIGGPVEIEGIVDETPFILVFGSVWDMITDEDNHPKQNIIWSGYKINWGEDYSSYEYFDTTYMDEYSPENAFDIIKSCICN